MLGAYQLDQARRNLSGYVLLGATNPYRTLAAITPSEAWKQAARGETGRDFSPGGWAYEQTGVEKLLSTAQVDAAAWSPNCASMPAPNLNLFQTASGLALGTTAAGVGILSATTTLIPAAAIPVVGAVIAGVGALVAVIGTILAHHGAAVRQEQQLGCAAIAAGNNSIALIDQAVRSGQLRPADASAGLDALVSKLSAFVAPAVKHNPCNANCELLVQFKAIANYLKSQYTDLAEQQPAPLPLRTGTAAPVPPVAPAAAAPISSGSVLVLPKPAPTASTTPAWVWLAAAGIAWLAIGKAF